jgi:hypothetical protein
LCTQEGSSNAGTPRKLINTVHSILEGTAHPALIERRLFVDQGTFERTLSGKKHGQKEEEGKMRQKKNEEEIDKEK